MEKLENLVSEIINALLEVVGRILNVSQEADREARSY